MNPLHNLASSAARNRWLHHPVLGDPSWDAFERESELPLFEGCSPLEWPVNGFLFLDPPSGLWHAYLSQYPRGYWGSPGDTRLLREDAPGEWCDLGAVLTGQSDTFDATAGVAGLTVDPSLVFDDGVYHLVYGWAAPDNGRGGLAYARGMRPEGPFERAPTPLHLDTEQPLLLDRYQRSYAPTLLRRERDWLMLCMMSTPQNLGGTWALCAMTALSPEGPYSPPTFLLSPQSATHHPPLLEFYPAFVFGGRVHAFASSVAANRNYQAHFAADLENAHKPEAWRLEQGGSLWHDTLHPSEAVGIWGQTLAGQVSNEGKLRVLAFSRSHDDLGTVHLAQRRWDQPYREAFVLSAPNADSHALLRSAYSSFNLTIDGQARGAWSLSWGCTGPLGPDRNSAGARPHPAMRRNSFELHSSGRVSHWDALGTRHQIGQTAQPLTLPLRLEQTEHTVSLWNGDALVWQHPLSAVTGRLILSVEAGSFLEITHFCVEGECQPAWERWLALEGLLGAAAPAGEWSEVQAEDFCHGFGLVSQTVGARLKWNFEGQAVRLLAPQGPEFGSAEVWIDGIHRAALDFYHAEPQPSAVLFEATLEPGLYALSLRITRGLVPADVLDVLP